MTSLDLIPPPNGAGALMKWVGIHLNMKRRLFWFKKNLESMLDESGFGGWRNHMREANH